MVIKMGMSEELYHRILWALQTLDKYHTTIAVNYPEDILSLMDDFCAWYETNGGK